MMRINIFLTFLLLSCSIGSLFADEGTLPEFTLKEREAFHQAMDVEIEAAQKRVNTVFQEFASEKKVFDPAAKLKLDIAKGALETKTILVNNYRWAPSTRSSLVRKKLLSILKKSVITMDDLHELEALVQQERLKLQE